MSAIQSGRAASLAAKVMGIRWLMRAPIWLFRAHLGFLTGSRLLMLEHIGRRSGELRSVVIEVVDSPRPGIYVVASSRGERSQWFRNIRANPSVRVSIGAHGPRAATARVMDADESRAAIRTYAAKHPHAWRALRQICEATLGTEVGADGSGLPLVCLDTTAPNVTH